LENKEMKNEGGAQRSSLSLSTHAKGKRPNKKIKNKNNKTI